MSSETILVVDDEDAVRSSLAAILSDEGYKVIQAHDGTKAINKVIEHEPDAVFLDIWLPPPGTDEVKENGGLITLEEIKRIMPFTSVIMISGHSTIDMAINAIKMGAYDFIEKPLSIEKILLTLRHALEQQSLIKENRNLKSQIGRKYNMVGRSSVLKRLLSEISLIAPTNSRVLIYGENGTGKELVARAIHNQSLRRDGPFVQVNCAAIPEELIESELFGHEKGAFTGSLERRIGKFELAHKGTLFLDEVGDMSLRTQAKVLRVLEESEIQRVGGNHYIKVDVRVIAASNKDLRNEIIRGNFRKDLFYRLNVIPITVPPLRERKEDIPLLVEYFIDEFCKENGKRKKSVTQRAMEVLINYPWPGNVRELRNTVERLVIMVSKDILDIDDIPFDIREIFSITKGKSPLSGSIVANKKEKKGDKHSLMENLLQTEYLNSRIKKLKEMGHINNP